MVLEGFSVAVGILISVHQQGTQWLPVEFPADGKTAQGVANRPTGCARPEVPKLLAFNLHHKIDKCLGNLRLRSAAQQSNRIRPNRGTAYDVGILQAAST